MKTAELTGAALDYWVARGLGAKAKMSESSERGLCLVLEIDEEHGDGAGWFPFSPSTNVAQGWPIIERERISFDGDHDYISWMAQSPRRDGVWVNGPTALIAAMRAFVCSVFGPEVNDEDVDARLNTS